MKNTNHVNQKALPESEVTAEPALSKKEQKHSSKTPGSRIKHHVHRVSKLTIIAVIMPLILIAAAWFGVRFINFDPYKTDLEELFLNQTGQTLKINGSIRLSLFPFQATLTDIEVKNKPGFQTKNLLEIESLDLGLSLWKLFIHQEVMIEGIEVDKARLSLEINKAGENNWNFLNSLSSLVPSKTGFSNASFQLKPVSISTEVGKSTFFNRWGIRTLILQNAEINAHDFSKNRHWHASDIDFVAFDIRPNTSFYAISRFNFNADEHAAQYEFQLSSQLTISQNLQKWAVSGWDGTIYISLPDEFDVPKVRLETHGDHLSWNLSHQNITINNASLNSQKGRLSTTFSLNYQNKITSKGWFSSEGINLQKWFRHTGVELPQFVNNTVLKNLQLSLKWVQNSESLALDSINLKWDKSQLTGRVLLQDTHKLHSKIHFNLGIDRLDLALYKAVKHSSKGAVTGKLPEPVEVYLPISLPIHVLREMNVEGKLKIEHFKGWGLSTQQVEMTLFADKGVVDIAPLDAHLYQGSLSSKFQLNVQGKTPLYHWQGRINRIEMKPFLQSGWGYVHLSGDGSGHFNVKSSGVNSQNIKENLSGSFGITMQEGNYQGLSLNKLARGKKRLVSDKTPYQQLRLEGQISRGIFKAKHFNIQTTQSSVIGVGNYNLGKNKLDMRLFVTYHTPPKYLKVLKGIELPIYIKGKPNEARWRIQWKGILGK